MTPSRVSLPDPIADALVESGDAVRPFTTRGAGAIEMLNFAIEGLNTGAAIVTLVGGVELYRKVARQIRDLAGERAVVVETADGERSVISVAADAVSVTPNAARSPEEAVEAIVTALEANAEAQSKPPS